MRKNLPHSPGIRTVDVMHVASEIKAHQLARRYNLPTKTVQAWLSGDEAMPIMMYELLAMRIKCVLPQTAGLFAGWHVINGERFTGPNLEYPGGLHWSDIDRMRDYRRARSLTERQCELIEQLTRERNFYKRQCELESRMGLMWRSIIDDKP